MRRQTFMSSAVKTDSPLSSFKSENLLRCFPDFPVTFIPLLEKYCNGENIVLTPAEIEHVTAHLTRFSRNILRHTSEIPRGETITYAELAKRAGCPNAVRAVGGALHRNPLPVLIPCHRVVAANSIGGYAFGIDLKRALLSFEKTNATHLSIDVAFSKC